MSVAFPIFLNLSRLNVVVVGGGQVGSRKARVLHEAGAAHIRVVSIAFSDQLIDSVERVQASYDSAHLTGANLVIAATNDKAVNRKVIQDAHSMGLLVNAVDSDNLDAGDFTTGSVVRRGPITIGIQSGGTPGISKHLARLIDQLIEQIIEQSLDPAWAEFAQAVAKVRREHLASNQGASLDHLTSSTAFDYFKTHGKLPGESATTRSP
jgi:siroheme synthase-like protein